MKLNVSSLELPVRFSTSVKVVFPEFSLIKSPAFESVMVQTVALLSVLSVSIVSKPSPPKIVVDNCLSKNSKVSLPVPPSRTSLVAPIILEPILKVSLSPKPFILMTEPVRVTPVPIVKIFTESSPLIVIVLFAPSAPPLSPSPPLDDIVVFASKVNHYLH